MALICTKISLFSYFFTNNVTKKIYNVFLYPNGYRLGRLVGPIVDPPYFRKKSIVNCPSSKNAEKGKPE